ncbi:MAG: ABC transporter permease, partial [Anaerolineae bacterium]
MSIRIIVGLTLREAARRKVLQGLLILSLVFLALYGWGMGFVQEKIVQLGPPPARFFGVRDVYNFLLMAGLYAANFLIVMLAVLTSVDTVAGEIASGTIQSLAVKPLRRRDILLGKWLGFVLMLGVYTGVMVGGVMGVTALITGYTPPNPLAGLGLMFLEALVLLSVSLLGGTRLSTLANGVLGFGLFGLAFIGGWIEQIGGILDSDAAVTIGHVASWLMPSEALWRFASSEMSQGLTQIISPFTGFAAPDPGVVIYAIAFAGVTLRLAVWQFNRRD